MNLEGLSVDEEMEMPVCEDCGGEIDWYLRIYHNITYECDECGKQENDSVTYYEDTYPNDKYRKHGELRPEPKQWHCPDHPTAVVDLLLEEINAEQRTDDNEPYVREDDPEVLESIEMNDEMCVCGDIYYNHYPPWSPRKYECKFETCSCVKFKLLEDSYDADT